MKVLILNQVFHPDVVSTAQHSSDLARRLVAAGHEVTAIASSRGYDDPSKRFPAHEVWKGVAVHRIGLPGLGKASRWRRAVDFAWFLVACFLKACTLPRQDVVLALTSPPLISVLGLLLVPWKARRLVFWAMDLNPDEAIAAGWLRAGSVTATALSWLQLQSMKKAAAVIALDRFMKERIVGKGVPAEQVFVLPPWSHDSAVRFDRAGRDAFRAKHGLQGKFVVMYSGNHSPCHPLDTVVDAARQLKDNDRVVFCFVGGGSEHRKLQATVAQEKLPNVLLLPYQPMEELSGSLSAADLHLVVMGTPFVGIVHPCKIYNILVIGAPVAYVGPESSHVTDLAGRLSGHQFISVQHGQAQELAKSIRAAAEQGFSRCTVASTADFQEERLVGALVDLLEQAAGCARAAVPV